MNGSRWDLVKSDNYWRSSHTGLPGDHSIPYGMSIPFNLDFVSCAKLAISFNYDVDFFARLVMPFNCEDLLVIMEHDLASPLCNQIHREE